MHKKPPKRLSNYKKAVKLEQGLILARLNARARWKKTKKYLELSTKEHIGKAIDRIDPLKALAILGLTPAVYMYLKQSPKISQYLTTWGMLGGIGLAIGYWLESQEYFGMFGKKKPEVSTGQEELLTLSLAFAISYIIVEHGGQLMGLLEKGIPAIVEMFLA
jgi:hypothetical protein